LSEKKSRYKEHSTSNNIFLFLFTKTSHICSLSYVHVHMCRHYKQIDLLERKG
jgi:hypothetical protein